MFVNCSSNVTFYTQLFCEAAGFPKPKVTIMKRIPKSRKITLVDFNDISTPLKVSNTWDWLVWDWLVWAG